MTQNAQQPRQTRREQVFLRCWTKVQIPGPILADPRGRAYSMGQNVRRSCWPQLRVRELKYVMSTVIIVCAKNFSDPIA